MNRKIVLSMVGAVALMSFGGQAGAVERLSQEQTAVVKSALLETLKDPDSARFKDLTIMPSAENSADVWRVCGFVNAKNSYGGYTGYTLFTGLLLAGKRNDGSTGYVLSMPMVGSGDKQSLVGKFCFHS